MFGNRLQYSFSATITIKETHFFVKHLYLIFKKNPAGFFPHFKMWGKNPARGLKNPAGFSKNPAGFFTLTFFFTMKPCDFLVTNIYVLPFYISFIIFK